MNESIDWKPFLETWSRTAFVLLSRIQADDILDIEADALARGTLMFPPAEEREIQSLEERIQLKLPTSYRSFLLTSNGWLQLGMDAEPGRLLAADRVGALGVLYPELIETFKNSGETSVSEEEYLQYGDAQSYPELRAGHIAPAIAISEHIDAAFYALNPAVTFVDGEWEAWVHRFWGQGRRFRSFWELMLAEKESCLRNLQESVEFRQSQRSQPAT
jgi:hypothetical protein